MKNQIEQRQTKKETAQKSIAKNEISAAAKQMRFAFVPIVREFRAHTQKNQARLWMPVETSLLVRYEFASCSLQTRYVFVAIVLFCGANGIEQIPLDARFMSSVLIADERTIQKSFDELLAKNLLVERGERTERAEKTERTEKKARTPEQTDRLETAAAGVSVESENFFQTAEENSQNDLPKIAAASSAKFPANGKNSIYSIEECLRYVEACQSKGETVNSPKALANHLHKTGEADAFIRATLYPAQHEELLQAEFGAPVRFSAEPCAVCFGAKMADADGRGFRACEHCRNERGKATGFEPEGDSRDGEK